ncbi:MAG TPA: M20/M25/M40 family metallo-hydrolase [Anaerolineales bacterium]|jgi:acetylornithine deacetylase/succinyl-diaminopimelate desuccinylase-like protein
MDLERLIANALAMQRIPAPTFEEDQRAELLHNSFRAAGLRVVEMDAAGNVYAQVGRAKSPPVVVSAHMDSVFPAGQNTPALRHDQRLHGPGIGDNAIALATLLELAIDLPGARLPCPVWLVGNVAEEGLGNLLGMQHVLERFGDQVRGYLVLEGMALGHVYHRGLPVHRLRLSAFAEGGHAWIHAGRPSAIHSLLALGPQLLAVNWPDTAQASLNIGRIVGGTSVNTIADHASFEIDVRAVDEAVLASMIGQIEGALNQASMEQGIELRLESIGHRPAGSLPPGHPLLQAAQAAATDAGLEPLRLETGSTDASLPLSLGLPAICVGITRGGGAHSQAEFIEIEPIAAGYQALRGLIRRAATMSAGDELTRGLAAD